jgi:uncharacterized protein YndB with AHSA1/START domain
MQPIIDIKRIEQTTNSGPERKKTEKSVPGKDGHETRLTGYSQDVSPQCELSSKWRTPWWNKPPYGPVSQRYVQWRT